MTSTKKQIDEKLKKLIVARLDTLPPNVTMSFGAKGSYTKAELIKNVREGTEAGQKIVEMQLKYLKFLKEGALYV